MSSYSATARRVGRFWEIEVPGVDAITQTTRLDQAAAMAADLVGALLEVDPSTIGIDLDVDYDRGIKRQIAEARQLRETAASCAAEASSRFVQAAHGLKEQGLTVRDIGTVLGVSFQRAQQLLTRG